MRELTFILWCANLVLDTGGHLAFKAAATQETGAQQAAWKQMARQPWLWLGVACFALEFLVWLAFLTLLPLSEGVLLGAMNIVVLMLAGRRWFNEKLTPWRVGGMALIALGVALVGVG